jgi:hypothetical protein
MYGLAKILNEQISLLVVLKGPGIELIAVVGKDLAIK